MKIDWTKVGLAAGAVGLFVWMAKAGKPKEGLQGVNYSLKTIKSVRDSFWQSHPNFKRKGNQRQNSYNADIRSAFVDYVDYLRKDGVISEKLANNVTL